ncbi:MAG: homocysteine S-methyltransferase [Thermoanaerobaculia bacterium]
MERPENPVSRFLSRQGFVLLDGGLATTLEAHGASLDDDLWSASVLLEAPEALRQVHRAFLEAGSDCIATVSYQASIAGFRNRGLTELEANELMRASSRLAVAERDDFWQSEEDRSGRLKPLVAASVGPYGAFLADGSEYTGDYGIGEAELRTFHQDRWRILAESEADLLACETIPSLREAVLLTELLEDTPQKWAWLSFSCRDDVHISDGTRLLEAARELDSVPRLVAIGVNCVSPDHVPSLIDELAAGTNKPIFVYPNQGEGWDAAAKSWVGEPRILDWGQAADEWLRLGASGVGGCCRVGPDEIAGVRGHLSSR